MVGTEYQDWNSLSKMGYCYRRNCRQHVFCLVLMIIIFVMIFRLNGILINKVNLKTLVNGGLQKENQIIEESDVKSRDIAGRKQTGVKRATQVTQKATNTRNNTEISKYILSMLNDIIDNDNTPKGKVNVIDINNFNCPREPRKVNGVEDLLCMADMESDPSETEEVPVHVQRGYRFSQFRREGTDMDIHTPPPVFVQDFKNPCWISREGKFRCLPYFQIIGMDKSGSTDLFDKIANHPDVLKNDGIRHKETMWWSWLRYGHWLKVKRDIQPFDRYLRYFSTAAETIQLHQESELITADGTPMDLWDMSGWVNIPQNAGLKEPVVVTPHLIKHMNPNVKLIIILRDPVERLFSDYFFLRQGVMTVEGFHSEVVKSIERLHSCTRETSLRGCLYSRQLHVESNARIHLGFYPVFLKDWLKVFPREQFFITTTEMYSQNASQTLQQAFDFLGLRNLSQMEVNKIVSGTRQHVTKNKKKAGKMLAQTRAILEHLYESFNSELATILADDKFVWEKRVQT